MDGVRDEASLLADDADVVERVEVVVVVGAWVDVVVALLVVELAEWEEDMLAVLFLCRDREVECESSRMLQGSRDAESGKYRVNV